MATLKKMSSSYKMTILNSVEEKIKYMLHKYPSTEWSGILFCEHKGSFEDNSLEIICKDVYPMDLGSSVFTQFKNNEDAINYMVENDLLNCELQLIHSHHAMSTTPSSTDTNTLLSEGQDLNNFVSLIVNNAGKYWAAVTRQTQIIIPNVKIQYTSFEDDIKEKTIDYVTAKNIEYFELNISKPDIVIDPSDEKFRFIDKRFEDIIASKLKVVPQKTLFDDWYTPQYNARYQSFDFKDSRPTYKKVTPAIDPNTKEDFNVYNEIVENVTFTVPKDVITEVCYILITCNLLSWKTTDVKNRVSLDVLNEQYKEKLNIYFKDSDFDTWADGILEYICINYGQFTNFKIDESLPIEEREELMDEASMYIDDFFIQQIINALEEIKNPSVYVKHYINLLNRRIF